MDEKKKNDVDTQIEAENSVAQKIMSLFRRK
jgi:hypothetical protein